MGIQFFKEARCQLSDPANPHTLTYENGGGLTSDCFKCGKQQPLSEDFHYHCTTCNVEFHSTCYDLPRKIRHIYHSQHPLTLIEWSKDETIRTAISEHVNSESVFSKCDWCGGDLDKSFYLCFICGFCLDLSCAKKSPPLTITYPKSHHHPLVFFPRPFLLPCDACGVVNISDPVYTCFQCHYVVHLSCIDLPREIKIMLHPHRLSYTPYFEPQVSTCQICYKAVNIKYGQYACYHEGCSYVAYSKCATHSYVWDGNELEWEPEETNETEDSAPFQKVGVDMIKYFCHEHHLKLQRCDRVKDADKQCEACIFPIDSRDFYACTLCDFYLHEVCASLPRKLGHASHNHPLFLETSPPKDNMSCSICCREFSGFQYKCYIDDCPIIGFHVDIRCILVPNVSSYKCHEHPLFINTRFSKEDSFYCNGCTRKDAMSSLQCTLCEFKLCYPCATLPDEVYYKHDEHPLSICYGEEVDDDTYWCETCENMIDPAEWFYACTQCCITIHSHCISGSSIYMKHGYTFRDATKNLEVVRNTSNTRPVCQACHDRCSYSVYFKDQKRFFCSTICAWICHAFKQKAIPL